MHILVSGTMGDASAAPPPNLFGLHEYDGLASFFGDQDFDYGAYILPPVSNFAADCADALGFTLHADRHSFLGCKSIAIAYVTLYCTFITYNDD